MENMHREVENTSSHPSPSCRKICVTTLDMLLRRLPDLDSFFCSPCCLYISHVVTFYLLRQPPGRIRDGVYKLEHSRAAGEGAGVDAKTVRKWVTEFCKDGKFVVPDRAYVKRQPHSFIDDEDIADKCREYIDQRIYRRKKDDRRFRIADFQR